VNDVLRHFVNIGKSFLGRNSCEYYDKTVSEGNRPESGLGFYGGDL
jgi:hypothetical protein